MSKNIVIPTCVRDQELLFWQIKGFDRYLDTPVNLHYVINERHDTGDGLENIRIVRDVIGATLSNKTKHNVVITDWRDLDIYDRLPSNIKDRGWLRQQIIKLLYPLDDPYLVLDTKDLLLKDSYWTEIYRHHHRISKIDRYPVFDIFLKNLFQTIPMVPDTLAGVLTPQIFDPAVVEKIKLIYGGEEPFLYWFDKFQFPSEFLLHDYVQQYAKCPDVAPRNRVENYGFIQRLWTVDKIWKTLDDFDHDDQKVFLKFQLDPFQEHITQPAVKNWIVKHFDS